jgi:hypothetical protein
MKLAELQVAVVQWLKGTFTEHIEMDRLERGDRLLEETLELLQSGGYPQERIAVLANYVYTRPAGEPMQELGSTLLTLAAYANAHYLSMDIAAHRELLRVWHDQADIQAKQKAKPSGSPLPQ